MNGKSEPDIYFHSTVHARRVAGVEWLSALTPNTYKKGSHVSGEIFGRIAARALDVHLQVSALLDQSELSAEDIHRVRVAAKELRAWWQVCTPWLGSEAEVATRALRDAAKTLSSARDTHVLLETLNTIAEEHGDTPFRDSVYDTISRERSHVQTELGDSLIDECRAAFIRDQEQWETVDARSRSALNTSTKKSTTLANAGLVRIYRKGRRLAKQAIAKRGGEHWHELRKWVKYLGFVLPLLGSGKRVRRAIARCVQFGKTLGELHDLEQLARITPKLDWSNCSGHQQKLAKSIIEGKQCALRRTCKRMARKLFRNSWNKRRLRSITSAMCTE